MDTKNNDYYDVRQYSTEGILSNLGVGTLVITENELPNPTLTFCSTLNDNSISINNTECLNNTIKLVDAGTGADTGITVNGTTQKMATIPQIITNALEELQKNKNSLTIESDILIRFLNKNKSNRKYLSIYHEPKINFHYNSQKKLIIN